MQKSNFYCQRKRAENKIYTINYPKKSDAILLDKKMAKLKSESALALPCRSMSAVNTIHRQVTESCLKNGIPFFIKDGCQSGNC